jgi:hypothetical protein
VTSPPFHGLQQELSNGAELGKIELIIVMLFLFFFDWYHDNSFVRSSTVSGSLGV